MKIKNIEYAGYILIILGLIGLISGNRIAGAITVLVLGGIILFIAKSQVR
jgi:hypothetical protein